MDEESAGLVMNNSETIDVIPNMKKSYESFEAKASKLLSKESHFMDGIISSQSKKKKIDSNK